MRLLAKAIILFLAVFAFSGASAQAASSSTVTVTVQIRPPAAAMAAQQSPPAAETALMAFATFPGQLLINDNDSSPIRQDGGLKHWKPENNAYAYT